MDTALSERLIGARVSVIGFDVEPAKCEKLRPMDAEQDWTVINTLRSAGAESLETVPEA